MKWTAFTKLLETPKLCDVEMGIFNIARKGRIATPGDGVSPRLKIKAKRPNLYTIVNSVEAVQ